MASKLKASISFPTAVFYGLGTILGAGIYVLVGKVAGYAGMGAPLSFVIAALLAIFSAFSYAELSSRFPKAAGAALYVNRGFGKIWMSRLTGLLVFISGLISAGLLAKGFAAYLQVFREMPTWIFASGIILVLTLFALLGIGISTVIITIITIVEVAGLLIIIWVARGGFAHFGTHIGDMFPVFSGEAFTGILLGAFLAFYAFIGFEDLANVAEEVKEPRKNMPRAIVTIMGLSTLLYILVAVVTVLSLPVDVLSISERPLALVYEQVTGQHPWLISLIALFSVINGILVQILMTSRLLYGMSEEGRLPKALAYVNKATQVPLTSTIVVCVVMLLFTLFFPLESLANYTSFVILLVFTFINLALFVLKLKDNKTQEHYRVPIWVPFVGMLVNLFFIGYKLISLM